MIQRHRHQLGTRDPRAADRAVDLGDVEAIRAVAAIHTAVGSGGRRAQLTQAGADGGAVSEVRSQDADRGQQAPSAGRPIVNCNKSHFALVRITELQMEHKILRAHFIDPSMCVWKKKGYNKLLHSGPSA